MGKATKAFRLQQREPQRQWWKGAALWYILGILTTVGYVVIARLLIGPL